MTITFKNFTKINEAEKRQVLQWRNADRVRLCMVNQHVISLENHLEWIDNLSKRDDCLYALVYDEFEPIGVTDLTDIDRTTRQATWGFYLAPGNRPGFGVVGFLWMENFFEVMDFDVLLGQSLADNHKSYHFHKNKFYFEECEAVVTTSGHNGQESFFFFMTQARWLSLKEELRPVLFKSFEPSQVKWDL